MKEREFWKIDAFSARPLFGNAAALVFDALDLHTTEMQAVAREMNLSETVFLGRPSNSQADVAVRFFTPRREVPFAGHPSIAVAYALHRIGQLARDNEAVLQGSEGLIRVQIETHGTNHPLFLVEQTLRAMSPGAASREELCSFIDVSPTGVIGECAVVSTGLPWLIAQLRDAETVAHVNANYGAITAASRRLKVAGLTIFSMEPGEEYCKVRTFAPNEGVLEDPFCGTGNGAVAAFLLTHPWRDRKAVRYEVQQGAEVEREGRGYIRATRSGDEVKVLVGGTAVVSAKGTLMIV